MNIIGILNDCDYSIPVKREHAGAGPNEAANWAVAVKMPSGWQHTRFFCTQDDALIEAARLDGQGIEAKVGNLRSKEIVWQSR